MVRRCTHSWTPQQSRSSEATHEAESSKLPHSPRAALCRLYLIICLGAGVCLLLIHDSKTISKYVALGIALTAASTVLMLILSITTRTHVVGRSMFEYMFEVPAEMAAKAEGGDKDSTESDDEGDDWAMMIQKWVAQWAVVQFVTNLPHRHSARCASACIAKYVADTHMVIVSLLVGGLATIATDQGQSNHTADRVIWYVTYVSTLAFCALELTEAFYHACEWARRGANSDFRDDPPPPPFNRVERVAFALFVRSYVANCGVVLVTAFSTKNLDRLAWGPPMSAAGEAYSTSSVALAKLCYGLVATFLWPLPLHWATNEAAMFTELRIKGHGGWITCSSPYCALHWANVAWLCVVFVVVKLRCAPQACKGARVQCQCAAEASPRPDSPSSSSLSGTEGQGQTQNQIGGVTANAKRPFPRGDAAAQLHDHARTQLRMRAQHAIFHDFPLSRPASDGAEFSCV